LLEHHIYPGQNNGHMRERVREVLTGIIQNFEFKRFSVAVRLNNTIDNKEDRVVCCVMDRPKLVEWLLYGQGIRFEANNLDKRTTPAICQVIHDARGKWKNISIGRFVTNAQEHEVVRKRESADKLSVREFDLFKTGSTKKLLDTHAILIDKFKALADPEFVCVDEVAFDTLVKKVRQATEGGRREHAKLAGYLANALAAPHCLVPKGEMYANKYQYPNVAYTPTIVNPVPKVYREALEEMFV